MIFHHETSRISTLYKSDYKIAAISHEQIEILFIRDYAHYRIPESTRQLLANSSQFSIPQLVVVLKTTFARLKSE